MDTVPTNSVFLWGNLRFSRTDTIIDQYNRNLNIDSTYEIKVVRKIDNHLVYLFYNKQLDFNIGSFIYVKEYGIVYRKTDKLSYQLLQEIVYLQDNIEVKKETVSPLLNDIKNDTFLFPKPPPRYSSK